MSGTPREATEATRRHNTAPTPAFDAADFERASRGLIAQHRTGIIDGPWGQAWNVHRYDFIEPSSSNPDTVHPSLWRQAQLNNIHGLFEVADGVWQARGYDLANITFVAGERGWIVIDPLTVEATAAACLELANESLGERPVTAVIYTHSHVDHFGGVRGVTTPEAVAAGDCRIIAPEGFLHEAISENVIAGFAMGRRAAYQFGPLLPPGPRGHVDCGLGKAVPIAAPGLLPPTEHISITATTLVVDGVEIVFQLTPNTEAPAEMNFFFPGRAANGRGWLCMAENCSHNMHNLVPLRGAQVRDALAWSKYIDEAIEWFGADTELMFASHHWPRWGNDDVNGFLGRQRDLYRFVHDQTMRHANHGATPRDIAEHLQLPAELRDDAATAGYYGHLAHNVKAVYQRYLSWYDGNPANLWRLPPTALGHRYVALAGGIDAMVDAARSAFDDGDYRWVVELLSHAVFAHPDHLEARSVQADAFEQLGYQSESATFRNAYLMAAQELRSGPPPRAHAMRRGMLDAMSVQQLLDANAIRVNPQHVAGIEVCVHLNVASSPTAGSDESDQPAGSTVSTENPGASRPPAEPWTVALSRCTMRARPGHHGAADAVIDLDRVVLIGISTASLDAREAFDTGAAKLRSGDAQAFVTLFANLDVFQSGFPIVEPAP